jgi:hypothetical protein
LAKSLNDPGSTKESWLAPRKQLFNKIDAFPAFVFPLYFSLCIWEDHWLRTLSVTKIAIGCKYRDSWSRGDGSRGETRLVSDAVPGSFSLEDVLEEMEGIVLISI